MWRKQITSVQCSSYQISSSFFQNLKIYNHGKYFMQLTMKSDNFLNNLIGYLYLKLRGNKIEKKKEKEKELK